MDYYDFTISDLIKAFKTEKRQVPRLLVKLYAYQLVKALGY